MPRKLPDTTDRTGRPQGDTVVVDTSVFFVSAQPWDVPELSELKATYVIPATALFELDRLMERVEKRDGARAALNVLKPLVDRGAMKGVISCGEGSCVRVALNIEEIPQVGLNLELADDRILALCINLKKSCERVSLATTEFALYAKAAAMEIPGVLVNMPEPRRSRARLSHREKEAFWESWQRVSDARSVTEMCHRAYQLLDQKLVQRLLIDVGEASYPELVASAHGKFQRLRREGGANASLSVVGLTFGLTLPPTVNTYTEFVITQKDQRSGTDLRTESPSERAIRLRRELAALNDYETRVVETMRGSIQTIRDYVMDQLGESLA